MIDSFNINLGCVVYTETEDGINAEWIFRKDHSIERGSGSGKRITEIVPERRFEGEFEIRYINSHGKPSPNLTLIIEFKQDHYLLTWKREEKITDIGIGIESDKKLIAGYNEY